MNVGMHTLGYGFGVALLIAGVTAALADLTTLVRGAPTNSRVGSQALIEKQPLALLRPPIRELLRLPSWLIRGLPGLLPVFACRGEARA